MDLSKHLILLTPLIVILYPFFGIHSIWAIFGAFLIDFDHYPWTILKLKTFSLKKCHYYHKNICTVYKDKDVLHIFHTIEFLIIMVISTIITYKINNYIYIVSLITTISIIYHQIFDIYDLKRKYSIELRAI